MRLGIPGLGVEGSGIGLGLGVTRLGVEGFDIGMGLGLLEVGESVLGWGVVGLKPDGNFVLIELTTGLRVVVVVVLVLVYLLRLGISVVCWLELVIPELGVVVFSFMLIMVLESELVFTSRGLFCRIGTVLVVVRKLE